MIISRQADGQNVSKAGQISLPPVWVVSVMYLFNFSLQITKFAGKELPIYILHVFFFFFGQETNKLFFNPKLLT